MNKVEKSPGQIHLEEIKELDRLIKNVKAQIMMEIGMLTDTSVHYKDIQIQTSGAKDQIGEGVTEIVELVEQLDKYKREIEQKKLKTLLILKKMRIRHQNLIMLYYMQNNTIEGTAEKMEKSYKWTWDNLQEAVKEFENLYDEESQNGKEQKRS